MAKRVLVTGGAGFIGHHLVKVLLEQDKEVIVLDDLSVGKRENVPVQAEFIEGDVRDAELVRTIVGRVDAVCHLAAKVSIRASLEQFYEDADVNLRGTLTILNQLQGSPVKRICFASSMAVYQDAPTPNPISENHSIQPLSPYGQSKLTAEYYLRTIAQELNIDWFNLRLFNTYGPGQTYTPYVGVITIFSTLISQEQRPTIYDDGNQRRDFVHVSDVVQAWLKALSAPSSASGTYNIGTGQATSVNELAGLILSILKSDLKPDYKPANFLELRNSIADISAAREKLGYEPNGLLAQKLPETLISVINQNR